MRYTNITEAHFRIVKEDWSERLRLSNYRPEHLNNEERNALLGARPAFEWSAALPATADFKERTETIAAPKDIKPGFYWLVVSHSKDFRAGDNFVTFTDFWVSDLSLVMRNRWGDGVMEGFVLNASSGEPIAEADVEVWHRQRDNHITLGEMNKSDKNGLFSSQNASQFGYLVQASKDGQKLATGNDYYNYRFDNSPKPYRHTVFFTDRSLYRPGQTVSFKGICVSVDQNGDNYHTLANQNVMVIFQDPNGKEIIRQGVRANEYGSFSGSFTAPRDRLMGRMMIRSEGDPFGQTFVNVEEYKRPKFQVTVDAPKTPAKLSTPVQLMGKAAAYTGSAIGGAKVRYRVVRETRYPAWYGWRYWWRPIPAVPAQEIAHGFPATEVDGSFPIQFLAKPDLSVPEKDEPTFRFTVYADVTDTTGETRSNQRTIQVAYTALKATLAADEWQTESKDVEIKLATETIDGEPQAATVKLKVYTVKQPEEVERATAEPVPLLQPGVPRRQGSRAQGGS